MEIQFGTNHSIDDLQKITAGVLHELKLNPAQRLSLF